VGGDWTYDEERVAAGDGRDGERAARLLSGEDAQSSAAASESHGGELRCHCVEGVRVVCELGQDAISKPSRQESNFDFDPPPD